MGVFNIDLNIINLDNNFDKDDPVTIILMRLWHIKFEKRKALKVKVPIAWHSKRWWNFFMSKVEKKECFWYMQFQSIRRFWHMKTWFSFSYLVFSDICPKIYIKKYLLKFSTCYNLKCRNISGLKCINSFCENVRTVWPIKTWYRSKSLWI